MTTVELRFEQRLGVDIFEILKVLPKVIDWLHIKGRASIIWDSYQYQGRKYVEILCSTAFNMYCTTHFTFARIVDGQKYKESIDFLSQDPWFER